jgi:hypothetical protein
MAIAMPGPDELPPGPVRDLVGSLHDLYDYAGRPAARLISREIHHRPSLDTVSHETVSAMLRGRAVPSWQKVQAIVAVLATMSVVRQDEAEVLQHFNQLWQRARSAIAEPAKASALADVPPRARVPDLAAVVGIDSSVLPPLRAAGEPVVGALPERTPDFTGRELLLDSVRAELTARPHAPMVLFGMAGAGKTALAREYVHRFAEEYRVIWWVPADSIQQARASLVSLAERLDCPLRPDTEQTVAGVISHLESARSGYLLVFDGAEDLEILRYVPAVGGHVIVTTRDPATRDTTGVGVEVPDFDRAEAVQFLRKRDPQISGAQADDVARTVGWSPLALEQATALRRATGMPWHDLLAALRDQDPELLAADPPARPRAISASVRTAWDHLTWSTPAAALVVALFAWFGYAPVPMALLRSGRAGDVGPRLARTLRDPIALRRAIAEASRIGLLRVDAASQQMEMQPLVRLALRDLLPPDALEQARHDVHEILAAADPGWPDELASWEMDRAIAPHVLPSDLVRSRSTTAQRVVLHQIRYRLLAGEYEDARRLAEIAIQTWRDERLLGEDDELLLRATREWAGALRAAGRYEQARELTASATTRLRAHPDFGALHPLTLALSAGVAADRRIAGDYRGAMEIDTENYQAHRDRHGPTDHRTLEARHNLGVDLRLLGDFATAAEHHRQELEQRQAAMGQEHGQTLLAVNALAEDLYGLGKYHDVLDMQPPYLDAARRWLGATHPGVILGARTVALARRCLAQRREALDELRSHYQSCVAAFGPDHEYTLAAALSCANSLRGLGYLAEAYAYAVEAVASYRRAFGPQHPLTLAAELDLAAIMRGQGARGSARQADTTTLAMLTDVLSERHPYTITAMAALATDLHLAGEIDGALALSERAYQVALEVRGARHPETLAIGANLALDRGPTGNGQHLLDEVLAAMRRTLGPDHPSIADATAGIRIEVDIEPLTT